jgi:hypothetical protein
VVQIDEPEIEPDEYLSSEISTTDDEYDSNDDSNETVEDEAEDDELGDWPQDDGGEE